MMEREETMAYTTTLPTWSEATPAAPRRPIDAQTMTAADGPP